MKILIVILILSGILFSCSKISKEDEYYVLNVLVLDYDSQLPIAGAKVRSVTNCGINCPATDSAITDVAGKVSFRFKLDNTYQFPMATKANYINQTEYYYFIYTNIAATKTDTLYLARPSFVNVTTHKTGAYLPQDSIRIQIYGDHLTSGESWIGYRVLHLDNANAPDKLFNLQAVYSHNLNTLPFRHQKVYFIKDIIRNGAVLSSQADSTNIIQFGTQNFTLNY